MDACTAVVVNFRTPELTAAAVRSFRRFYPAVPLLLVDNGSDGEGRAALSRLADGDGPATRILWNDVNRHHGPAMDQAAHVAATPLLFFFDSDIVVTQGGFLEAMAGLLGDDAGRYAVGKRIVMDERGFDLPATRPGIPYIRPIAMLLRRETYLSLPPFRLHGAPCLENMRAAGERGLALIDFPVEQYLLHEGRGTAGRHGYRLGWRGKINHLLHKLGL